jgi:hypothetical protein
LGFRDPKVRGSGVMVKDLGLRVEEYRVWGIGLGVHGLGLGIWG